MSSEPDVDLQRPDGLVLSLDQTRQSFELIDATERPKELAWAFDLVVQGYLPLASRTLDPWDVRQDVCDDAYHRHGIARTLVLTGSHPETGERELLGTIRITMGSTATARLCLPPLEAMGLMAPSGGWENFHFEGFDVDQVAEGGRTAVSPTCRIGKSREIGLAPVVLRTLFEEAFRFAAQHYGKTQYWGILPYYVIERVEALGIHVIRAPEMSYRMEENADIFNKYDRYWLQSRPAFCKVVLPSMTMI
jgi:hypothetical protein